MSSPIPGDRTPAVIGDLPPGPKSIGPFAWVLFGLIFAAMIGVGAAGGYATYSNMVKEFANSGTAIGIVAVGEGATLIMGLTLLALTLISRPYPTPLRLGLWLIPLAGSAVGLAVAPDLKTRVVYALTPLAMTVAAEVLGFVSRSIVVTQTGVDAESRRRTADTSRLLAFHRARSQNHPWKWVKSFSGLRSWMLLRKVGQGDMETGVELTVIARIRLTEGASSALADMYRITPDTGGHALSGGADTLALEGGQEADKTPILPDSYPDKEEDTAGQTPDTIPDDWAELLSTTSGTADAVRTLRDKGCPPADTVRLLADTYPDWTQDTIKRTVRRIYGAADNPGQQPGQQPGQTTD